VNVTEHDPFETDALYASWRDERARSGKRLRDWIAERPEYAPDFVCWASAAALMERAEVPYAALDEITAEEAAAAVIREMRARYETPISDLLTAVHARGLTVGDLARHLRVGPPLVVKLRQRLVRFAGIPDRLCTQLGELLGVGPHQIRDYLRQPPSLARGAVYKADEAPTVAVQEEWAAAVRGCPGMTASDRALWLDTEA
jgi:hypothetical protein